MSDRVQTRVSRKRRPLVAAVSSEVVSLSIPSLPYLSFAQLQLMLRTSDAKTTKAIPFFNVLWTERSEFGVTIHYAQPTSKNVVRVAAMEYLVDKPDRPQVTTWMARLLDRAYGESQRNKRIKVLINPFGGQGKAQKWYTRDIEPIFAAARCRVTVERTQFQGHAVEIAEKIDTELYDVIATCSGDGLPHEVFNGLGRKRDAQKALSRIAVAQLPCGSGNAMSWSLNGTDSTSLAALCIVKGIRTPMDLTSITQGDRRTLSFLSQSVGIVADCDLGTDHLRWLGDARFTYGFLVRLLRKTVYPCDLAVKVEIGTKAAIREHCLAHVEARRSMEGRRKVPGRAEQGSVEHEEGLPTLRYGSIGDDLPEGWNLVPYDKLGNFYAGNMVYMARGRALLPRRASQRRQPRSRHHRRRHQPRHGHPVAAGRRKEHLLRHAARHLSQDLGFPYRAPGAEDGLYQYRWGEFPVRSVPG